MFNSPVPKPVILPAVLMTALLLWAGCCHSQTPAPDSKEGKQYPFIRYEANQLHYDSTSASMQLFLRKWHRVTTTGQGSVNIIHIGGSHVQAGVFPNQVRTNLLSSHPSLIGGRGMIFPYSAAAKCNNPDDYKVHCAEKVTLTRNVYASPEYPLGLCGIAVTARDAPTRIQILNTEKGFDYRTTHIVILGQSNQGIVPAISYEGRDVPPSYIDTATHRFVFNLRQPVDSFDIVLPCQMGQTFTLTGVCLGNRSPGISYHSIGVNGAAVPDYLKCSLSDDLKLLRPDLVIFGIGINDAAGKDFDTVAFKNNYLALCDTIRSVNPHCAFIFVTNNDSYRKTGRRRYAVNNNGPLAREVCYRLADITGGAVWDQFEIMGGLKSMEKWQKEGLAQKDKVHFTRAGYRLIGNLLFEAMQKEFAKPLPAVMETPKAPAKKPARNQRGKDKRRVTIQSKPSSNNSNPDSDRFPYIPD